MSHLFVTVFKNKPKKQVNFSKTLVNKQDRFVYLESCQKWLLLIEITFALVAELVDALS